MRIKHITKDGVVRDDISGHVVRVSDVKTVYTLMEQINKRKGKQWK